MLFYSVIATLPDAATRDRYIAWLAGGHIQQVCAGGASLAEVIRLDGEPLRVITRYEFPSRAAYDRYLSVDAPRLRAEGAAQFGATPGVVFERLLGESVARYSV